MNETDSLRSIIFNYHCIHPSLKFPAKFKCPDFKNDDEKVILTRILSLWCNHGTIRDNDKLIVQIFLGNLTRVATGGSLRLKFPKIRDETDFAHLFTGNTSLIETSPLIGNSYND